MGTNFNGKSGSIFNFDIPPWDDSTDFNFLQEPQDPSSLLSSTLSPMAQIIPPTANNQQSTTSNAVEASPVDYAAQLQHYQNLLLETQTMLNMKQQGDGEGSVTAGLSPSLSQFGGNNNLNASLLLNQKRQQQQQPTQTQSQPTQTQPQQQNPQLQQHLFQVSQSQLRNEYGNDTPTSNNNSKPTTPVAIKTKGKTSKKKSEPPQPRTKIRPCDHCRRRKTKCVTIPDQHTCKMCQSKGLKCTFYETSASSLKRSLNADDANKRMKFDDPTIQPPPNVQVRDVPPIKDYSTMQGNSLLKRTLSLQYPRSSFYVGPTSIYDAIFLDKVILDKIDQFTLNKSNSVRKVAGNVQFLLRDDFSEVLYEKAERDSDTVEKYVAPHGQALIDLYFRTVHPSFPILHKKIFLEKYFRTHREFGAPLLAAVYLLAIQWWDYEPSLSQFPKPNIDSLHKFAMHAFSDIIQRPKLSAVQAGLLLLQFQPPNLVCGKAGEKNWLLCAQVVALAEELGLGLDCSNWRLPKWERSLRRRLAWAVYIQDKWSSLIESRPSHIHEGINWLVRPVSEEDFPEKASENLTVANREVSVDIELGKECFLHLVSLSQILCEIQDTFFTAKAMQEIRGVEQVLLIAKPLQLKLRNWYHTLPKSLQMSTLKPRQFNSNGNLQLAYFATEMTLHRRIISAIHYSQQAANYITQSPGSVKSSQSPHTVGQNFPHTQLPPQVIEVCRNAARARLTAAIDFTRELKAEHMQAFWHNSSARNFALIGSFAALLYATSASADEAHILRENVMDYRWLLKVNSRSFSIARDALELVDGVLRNIPGLLTEQYGTPGTPKSQSVPENDNRNLENNNINRSTNVNEINKNINKNYNNINNANIRNKNSIINHDNSNNRGGVNTGNGAGANLFAEVEKKESPSYLLKGHSTTGSPLGKVEEKRFNSKPGTPKEQETDNMISQMMGGEVNGINMTVLNQMNNLMSLDSEKSEKK
ncbi:Dal81 protein [Martiniozyma asiatica (nom. inval.)]|nr:Dal81 protein [Martiniozyma asiatica]